MIFFKYRLRMAVWATSAAVGISIMLLPLLLGWYVPEMPYLIPLSQRTNNVMVLGLLVMLSFPAVVEFFNFRWVRQADRNIPRFLRDLAEAVRSGVTLPRALEEASQRDYGPLSKELEKTMAKFIMGASWEEAIMTLYSSIKRPGVLRLCTILVEANQAGGRMVDVLDSSVDLFTSIEDYKEEQYTNMRPYLLTIYMSSAVFLIIAFVVLHEFLVPLFVATESKGVKEAGVLANVLDINYYASILFWGSFVEAVFGGFIAGKIVDRSLLAGLCHSVILVVITLVFFNLGGV
jgi:flagellar protein FlaJ